MTYSDLEIRPMDVRTATDQECAAANVFNNRIRAERLPDDPPIPLQEMVQGWRNLPALRCVRTWSLWKTDHSEIVARAEMAWMDVPENRHLVDFGIMVLPEYRCRGWARRLLALVAAVTREQNRHTLFVQTIDRVPAGAEFMRRLGAQAGLETHINQLLVADLNRELVRAWQARAPERAGAFELGFWEGAYPEEELQAIAELTEVMNGEPRGTLQFEDERITPELLRQIERSMFARGNQRMSVYAREKATGRFAGFTEVLWNPNRPDMLQQEATGVFPAYRNRGIGRWMKAAMLERVLRAHPEITRVRTGNADSNAAMLHINLELGYKPYIADTIWQVEREQVEKYLQAHA